MRTDDMRERAERAERQLEDHVRLLSAALDEIHALRTICAYEGHVVKTYTEYKSFPKSRRTVADNQMRRLHSASVGQALRVNQELPSTRWLRSQVGLLTVPSWREEVQARSTSRRKSSPAP